MDSFATFCVFLSCLCLCLVFLSYLCFRKTQNASTNRIKTDERLSLIIQWMRASCRNGPPYPHRVTVWLNDWLTVADESRFWWRGATVVAGMGQHLSCQLWGRAAGWPSPQLRSCPWGQCHPDVGGHRSVSWLVDVLCFKLFVGGDRSVSWLVNVLCFKLFQLKRNMEKLGDTFGHKTKDLVQMNKCAHLMCENVGGGRTG